MLLLSNIKYCKTGLSFDLCMSLLGIVMYEFLCGWSYYYGRVYLYVASCMLHFIYINFMNFFVSQN